MKPRHGFEGANAVDNECSPERAIPFQWELEQGLGSVGGYVVGNSR